jgi:nitrite reductase (NO-forming)
MRSRERTADRRVTSVGLGAAGGFLLLATWSLALPAGTRHGAWLPLHLALAGGASQAIAAALPFFTASLLAGRPAPWELRTAVLALLGCGAAFLAVGVTAGMPGVAAGGGVLFVGGMGMLGIASFMPLRRTLGRRHPLILAAYAIALADVGVGATLATFQVAGFVPVADDWAWLKPAHAWLNLLGFVSLAIAGTLIHLYPTVVGSRITGDGRVRVLVGGLAVGAPTVAAGYVLRIDPLGRIGAAIELAGLLALAGYVGAGWRARGRWTGDLAWRRIAIGSLGAGVAWFGLGVGVAAIRVMALGAIPDAWSLSLVGVPLAGGWVAQSIIGGWTHLLPALSGGSPQRHALQRRMLGVAATGRLVVMNGGVALLAAAGAWSYQPGEVVGACLVAAALVVSLAAMLAATFAPEPRARPSA